MKKVFSIGMVFLLLLLAACTPAATSNVDIGNSDAANSEGMQGVVPAFPKINPKDIPALGIAAGDESSEFTYESNRPDDAFLDAWRNLNAEHLQKLLDMENFLPIGEYTLFFYNSASDGLSKICIDSPDGSTQQIFTCTRPIGQLNISPTGKPIIISITAPIYGGASIGNLCEFNMENGEMRILSYMGNTMINLSDGYFYYGNYYIPTMEETAYGIGDAGSLKRWTEGSNDYTVIIERFDRSYAFANGNVYYRKPNDAGVYYRVLEGDSYQQEFKLVDTINQYSFIYGDYLLAGDRDEISRVTMIKISTGEVIAEFKAYSINNASMFDLDGFYFVDTEYVLQYSNFDGVQKPMLTEVEDVNVQAVRGGWVYFKYQINNGSQYNVVLGKVRLDGTGIYFFT
jgi:hypothetical protein